MARVALPSRAYISLHNPSSPRTRLPSQMPIPRISIATTTTTTSHHLAPCTLHLASSCHGLKFDYLPPSPSPSPSPPVPIFFAFTVAGHRDSDRTSDSQARMSMEMDMAGAAPRPMSPVSNPGQFFKRAYQACTNCRIRKVKCIIEYNEEGRLQSSCTRCKRELRKCMFSADRRTQATAKSNAQASQRTVEVLEGTNVFPRTDTFNQRCDHINNTSF